MYITFGILVSFSVRYIYGHLVHLSHFNVCNSQKWLGKQTDIWNPGIHVLPAAEYIHVLCSFELLSLQGRLVYFSAQKAL